MMYTISELAKEFGLTTRTIRYYEELGLLEPARTDRRKRIFLSKDYTRLKLILRGKKFGFSLDEIKEMVLLYELDPSGQKQLKRTIDLGERRIKEVSERIQELMEMKQEMEVLKNDFVEKLTRGKGESTT